MKTPPDAKLVDLLVYDQPLPSSAAQDGLWRFDNLPFALAESGADFGDHPSFVTRFDAYQLERRNLLVGLEWLLAVECDVLNLSIGPPGRFLPGDPLQIATRAFFERSKPVVVAAGNSGPEPQSLQMLARAPWVISVAAVTDDKEPAADSSRGGGGLPGPTCASYGRNRFKAAEVKTSFAAPRVTQAAAFTQKCLELLVSDLRLAAKGQDGEWSTPVAMPWIGFADTGWDPKKAPYRWGPVAASLLPDKSSIEIESTTAERHWARTLANSLGGQPIPDVTPTMVSRALILGAQPLELDPEIVGCGLVTMDTAAELFRNLNPSIVRKLLGFEESVDRNESDLGMYWGSERTQITEDAFGTGIRFSVARVHT